jgi:hypothetical protein
VASRKPDPRQTRRPPEDDRDAGHPCSRTPPELCDGARLAVQPDGTSRREPALTPRAFCEPCERRIVTCLEELPAVYERLEAAIADPVRRSGPVRVMPGSRVLVGTEEFDLMSTMAAVLGGWAARVRRIPGLQLSDPGHAPGSPEAIEDACVSVLARHKTPLLALRDGWAFRTFTYQSGPSSGPHVSTCRRCAQRIIPAPGRDAWRLAAGGLPRAVTPASRRTAPRPCEHEPDGPPPVPADIIPAYLLDLIGDREIVRQGEGWVTILDRLDGAAAGSEILDLHWRARRLLGETKARPEEFDGVPCRSCECMTLERAEPPSDPSLAASHSRCPGCGDEMDRETFAEWAGTYASWARGAGIKKCRRCSLVEPKHEECCWHACSCAEGEHPRRRAVA